MTFIKKLILTFSLGCLIIIFFSVLVLPASSRTQPKKVSRAAVAATFLSPSAVLAIASARETFSILVSPVWAQDDCDPAQEDCDDDSPASDCDPTQEACDDGASTGGANPGTGNDAKYNFLGNPLAGQKQDAKDSLEFKPEGVDVSLLVGRVIKGVIGVSGMIAFVMVVYGGLLWLFAGGNEEKVTQAKKTLIWASLGLIVIFAAYALVSLALQSITKATLAAAGGK